MLLLYLQTIDDETDRERFIRLYEQYGKLLLSVAREKLKRKDLAEDCLQETFLDVSRQFDQVKKVSRDKIEPYLITIVKRKCILMNNDKSFQAETSLESWMEDNGEGLFTDEEFWQDVSYLEAADVIDQLPDNLRDTCLLKYVYDYDNKTIAKKLGITEENVRVRISRAKRELKLLLERNEEC